MYIRVLTIVNIGAMLKFINMDLNYRLMNILQKFIVKPSDLLSSKLYDEKTFYKSFTSDVNNCDEELIIESPFITSRRIDILMPVFQKALIRGVAITVITRDPRNCPEEISEQAEREINFFNRIGIQTTLCDGNHHRKLALLDRRIIWEGSLNILSQNYSKEIMRRIESEKLTKQMY